MRQTLHRAGKLLTEAIDQVLAEDLEAGKAVLRDDFNATISFERLAEEPAPEKKR